MTTFIHGLFAFGTLVLNVVVVGGLLFALGRVALGRRGAWGHLLGVLLVMGVAGLLLSGQLGGLVSEAVHYITTGGGTPVLPGVPSL